MRTTYNIDEYAQTIIINNPNLTFKDLNNELKNTQSKITYICTEHGEAERKALYLYEGRGCSKCAFKIATNKKTFTLKDFIKKSKEIHGEKYDYSKSIYTTAMKKLTIGCPIHGDFEQAPRHHLNGSSCIKCHYHLNGYGKTKFINSYKSFYHF